MLLFALFGLNEQLPPTSCTQILCGMCQLNITTHRLGHCEIFMKMFYLSTLVSVSVRLEYLIWGGGAGSAWY